jgi:hypothetical protein
MNETNKPDLKSGVKQSFGRSSFRILDSSDAAEMSVEEEVVHIAVSDIVKTLSQEGVSVDGDARKDLSSQIRCHVQSLIGNSPSSCLNKKEIAIEALALCNVASLKQQARKTMLQKKTVKLTSEKKWFIINHTDQRKLIWDIICVVLLIYSIFEIPFSISFRSEVCDISMVDNINLLVDCFFCIDCVFTFFTSFVDKETGIVVVDHAVIVHR